jgi:hypothetical protein
MDKPGCESKRAVGHKLPNAGQDVPTALKDFHGLLGKLFRQQIPDLVQEPFAPEKLKKLMAEPLMSLSPSASRDEVSLAGSLFMGRKVLPVPAGDDPIPGYILKMGRDQTPKPDFCSFAAKELQRMFPLGWDSRYVQYCSRTLPSAGACTERSRKHGGARERITQKMSRESFVNACLTGQGIEIKSERHVKLIEDNGKVRIVTIACAAQHILGPLHHLLYDHISRRKWLLKGEATANSFSEFDRVRGEVFVSGDYEAATDNFNTHHSEFILECILRSSNIPEPIQRLALGSLRGTLLYKGVSHPQVAGQLMGNLLSFPLLCITNYLAFKYAIPRTVPLRINGDDIVFRATPSEAEHWMQVVAEAGLTLSRGKTIVHARFFSLNSTFFQARTGRKPSLVPIVRAKAMYAPLKMGAGNVLAARLRSSSKGLIGWRKGMVRGHILRYHRKAVLQTGCSLNRALGVRVTHDALVLGRLMDHEVHYLGAPAQLDKPRRAKHMKVSPKAGDTTWYNPRVVPVVPATEGWTQIAAKIVTPVLRDRYTTEWAEHCLENAWQPGVKAGENELAPALYGFCPFGSYGEHARRLKVTRRGLGRLLGYHWRRLPYVRRWIYDTAKRRKDPDKLWVPKGCVPHLRPATGDWRKATE